MLIVLASKTLNSLQARPSPLSLASQHLHGNMYLIPLVGTATDSSSTNQQLSGVMPLWPSWWRDGEWHKKGEDGTGNWYFSRSGLICMIKCWINQRVAGTASSARVWRQQRGDDFTSKHTVPDSHFHPLDLSYVGRVADKVVHGAGYEASLSLRQVQPQALRLHVVGANNDDVSPGCRAAIAVNTRG